MSSSVLNGKIPAVRVLFPTKSLFAIASKIFDRICFVRDVCSHRTTLDPKFLKCVFLGDLRVQKGYHSYCPTLNRYLVPSYVIFFETLPFSQPLSRPSQGENKDLLSIRLPLPHHPLLQLPLCLFPSAHLFVMSTPSVLHCNLQTHSLHH